MNKQKYIINEWVRKISEFESIHYGCQSDNWLSLIIKSTLLFFVKIFEKKLLSYDFINVLGQKNIF